MEEDLVQHLLISDSYSFSRQELQVNVYLYKCEKAAVDASCRACPYRVRLHLLPDLRPETGRETPPARPQTDEEAEAVDGAASPGKSSSPLCVKFNQSFRFRLDPIELQIRSLMISVWTEEESGKRCRGWLILDLVRLLENSANTPKAVWQRLSNRFVAPGLAMEALCYRGDLKLALRLRPCDRSVVTRLPGPWTPWGGGRRWELGQHSLTLWVVLGTQLPGGDGSVHFVSASLMLPNSAKPLRRRTKSVGGSDLDKYFNTVLTFDAIPLDRLRDAELSVRVHRARCCGDRVVGEVKLSSSTGGTVEGGQQPSWRYRSSLETLLWRSLFESPDTWLHCRPLRLRPPSSS